MRPTKRRTITSFEDAMILLVCWFFVVWLILRG
jgi:hypothetical protein